METPNFEVKMKSRIQVLRMSLVLEKCINKLILFNLGIIYESSNTKLFSSKNALSFKSKVELLFDLNVIDKEQLLEFELFMTFRNKFMHDIEIQSYVDVVNNFDSGLNKRFKKFVVEKSKKESEEKIYEQAVRKLHLVNIRVIQEKINEFGNKIEYKESITKLPGEITKWYKNNFFEFVKMTMLLIESSKAGERHKKKLISDFSILIEKQFSSVIEYSTNGPYGNLLTKYDDPNFRNHIMGLIEK